MKQFLLGLCLAVTVSVAYGQKEANTWYFGQFAGVDFNSGNPVALTNGKLNTNEGCTSISDRTTGQLLFYTDGSVVFDRTHTQMPNGFGLKGNTTTTQSAVVLPQPGSTTRYYLFTLSGQAGFIVSGDSGINYSIVDMTLNGGKGDIINKNTPLITPACEKLAAVKHCNGKDIWVVVHQWRTNAFYAYLLTSVGLSGAVVSNTGIVMQDVGSGQNAETIGYMKFSPDGKKLAMACYNNLNTVQICDFNNQTGVVSNAFSDSNYPNAVNYDGPYGISFSPDNSRLYVSVYGYQTPSYVYQYNMMAGSSAAIIASRTQIVSRAGFGLGTLQIAPNGKIYVALGDNPTSNTAFLDVINNPNALGTACNYVTNAVSLLGRKSLLGLPDFVESFLGAPYTGTLTYTGCSGTYSILFSDSLINGTVTYFWNFGDPASGIYNTSTLQNPTHTFSSSGNYTVKLYLNNGCVMDTITKYITISGGITLSTTSINVTCHGGNDGSATVSATGTSPFKYTWSPSGGTNAAASGLIAGSYSVTVTDNQGCSKSQTIVISEPPPIVLNFPRDYYICGEGGGNVQLTASGGTTYLWSPGLTLDDSTIANPISNPFVTTTYIVTVANGACFDTAHVTVHVSLPPNPPSISQSGDTLSVPAGYISYQWFYQGVPIAGATNHIYVAPQTGQYAVNIVDQNHCSVLSSSVYVIAGINSPFEISNEFEIYPNPAGNAFTVSSLRFTVGDLALKIFNVLGEKLYSTQLETVNGKLETVIDISSFSKGVYFLLIESEKSKYISKFTKE